MKIENSHHPLNFELPFGKSATSVFDKNCFTLFPRSFAKEGLKEK